MLSVVVVNYRTASHLGPLVEAIERAKGRLEVETIVVDSASPDRDEAARVPCTRFLALPENRGFGAGANAGAAVAMGELVLFANPDARPERDALPLLRERMRPGVGAVGPRLVDARGRRQIGDCGEAPTVLRALAWALGLHRLGVPALFSGRDVEERTGWLSGAFLLVDARAFREAGGFDERYFLFGEDVDLGERLARAGRASVYVPSVRVLHEGGASYRGKDRKLEGLWAASLARVHSERSTPVANAVFRFVLAAGLAGKAIAHAALGRERRSRSLLAAARRAIRT